MEYSDFNIVVKTGKTSGEYQTTCPQCSQSRKKKTDKCLSINLESKVWHCHHCGWKGGLFEDKRPVEWVKPAWKNNTDLSTKAVLWFASRGISQTTLLKMKITEGLEWMPQVKKEVNTIQFNYFEGETLVNTKFRDGAKNFKMVKDAEKIPYNINSIIGKDEIIIVEGEIDVLSWIEAGIENVISVPNGANSGNNNLSYLDRFYSLFSGKRIVIATDNDINGRSLLNALADRFGRGSCYWIDFGKYKDSNEVLKAEGINGILSLVKREFEIVGSVGVSDYYDEVADLYENGLDEGCRIGDGVIDENLRFAKGYITTVTGIPGHGKSEFVDHLVINLITKSGWKGAFYSPENKPTRLHISKLVRKISGKGWYGYNKISPGELKLTVEYLDEKVWFIKPPKGFSLDNILDSVKELKLRKNIDFFVIDAWNKLEHNYDQNETKYIGQSLDKLAVFCEEFGVHCFLVAHPTKISKDKTTGTYEIPNLYSIAGSANFYNKTDNGITVYRRFNPENVNDSWSEVHVQKVKFNHWGKIGMVEYDFDGASLRYSKRGSPIINSSFINKDAVQEEMQLQTSNQFPNAIKPNTDFEILDKAPWD